jgi:hypothetical protein
MYSKYKHSHDPTTSSNTQLSLCACLSLKLSIDAIRGLTSSPCPRGRDKRRDFYTGTGCHGLQSFQHTHKACHPTSGVIQWFYAKYAPYVMITFKVTAQAQYIIVFIAVSFIPSIPSIAREFNTTGAVVKYVHGLYYLIIYQHESSSLAVSLSMLTNALGMLIWARYSGFCNWISLRLYCLY